jgi:thiosulfate/3-mercaptopyruvate sulfurtransferase
MFLPVIVAALLAADDKPTAYPRTDMLVEAADLLPPDALAAVRVLDARSWSKYLDGHIPGAVWVDHDAWKKKFAESQDPTVWADLIGGRGVERDSHVIVVDDDRGREAARIWFLLRYFGVRNVRLLNGGWSAYTAAGGKVVPGEIKPEAVQAKLEPQSGRLATKQQLADWLKGEAPQVIDARSADEYFGEQKSEKRCGAIPGAVHVEWAELVDKKTGRFKSPEELTKIFKDAGIDPNKPAVTYCQSGGRAAVDAFVLELMGGKDVRNYYRSWAEWANDEDVPIFLPKPKPKK